MLLWLPVGCSGMIHEPGVELTSGAPSQEDSALAPAGLRRLTRAQYLSSVRDLLGIEPPVLALEPDTAVNGFEAIGASHTTISPLGVEKYETAAHELARLLVEDPDARYRLVPCDTTTSECLSWFAADFGLRAWRRPLEPEELSRYLGLGMQALQTVGDAVAGVQIIIAAMLQSPNFLFRTELGVMTPDGRRYDSWEMASRLSFALWNTVPDAELLAAAASGELLEDAPLRAQAERLVASPRAYAALRDFFDQLLKLTTLEDLNKNSAAFPQMSATLGVSMRESILSTVSVWALQENRSYSSFFTSHDTTSTMSSRASTECPSRAWSSRCSRCLRSAQACSRTRRSSRATVTRA